MNRILYTIATVAALASLSSCHEKIIDERPVKPDTGADGFMTTTYMNPVIRNNAPDPSVFDDRERTGYFYAYSTQNGVSGTSDVVYLPVYRSKDMVNWELVGNAFGGMERPQWVPDTRIWAPDIEYIDGRYCLYYAEGHWDDPKRSACGVAVSNSPTGPFTWTNVKDINPLADSNGKLVDYASQNVSNSIDPDVIRDEVTGDYYLFWGSFGSDSGIWAIQLTSDGLAIAPGAEKVFIAYDLEGTYVHYKNGYYYCFGSKGSCCEGANSTYHVVVGRSKNVLGPYEGKDGNLIPPETPLSTARPIRFSAVLLQVISPVPDTMPESSLMTKARTGCATIITGQATSTTAAACQWMKSSGETVGHLPRQDSRQRRRLPVLPGRLLKPNPVLYRQTISLQAPSLRRVILADAATPGNIPRKMKTNTK